MKLALVADTFPPMRTSGAVQLRDLVREFIRQGHEMTVLLPSDEQDAPWNITEHDGARIVRLASPKTKDVGYARRTIGEWLMPYAMKRNLLKSPLAAERWEGVLWYSPSIFHGPLVRFLKLQSGCKSYLIVRDIFPEWALDLGLMRPGLAYAFFKMIAQQQYDTADIIGVQSPGNLGYFDKWVREGSGRRLEVLQNWLSQPANLPCSIQLDASPLAGRKIFVYAGNMGVAQGLDLLIELAGHLRDRRELGFLFVGRGSEVPRLKAMAAKLGLDNVLFHPEIDPDEIAGLYAQCAVGIVCLDKRHKAHNIPGKFLTYMQNGLPVLAVVNKGNDLTDVIRTESVGEVCETHDIDELTTLCAAIADRIERDGVLSERCCRLFEREFSVSRSVEQIVASLDGGSGPNVFA